MYISIIIPGYNEEKRILPTIKKVLDFFNSNGWSFEIIFVDDGSKDRTLEVLKQYENNPNFRIIKHEINKGKGSSVKTGVLASEGDLILFSDSDLSTPIEELSKLIKEIDNYDMVIGSRAINKDLLIKKQPLHRVLIGFFARNLIRFVLGLNYRDTQCGFKLFKREVALTLFNKMKTQRWSFDYELLFLAKKYDFKTKEIPVIWVNDEDSRVNSLIDPIKSSIDLIKIRFNKY